MNVTEYVLTVHYPRAGTKVYRFFEFKNAAHGLNVAARSGMSVEFRTETREV